MSTDSRIRAGTSRTRAFALVLSVACLTAPLFVLPAADAAAPAPPKFLGPLLSRSENPNVTLGRDGGFSVPLPNGKVLWIYADTPRLEYTRGAWRLRSFIGGSSAAIMPKYTPGKAPTQRVTELMPGKSRPSTAAAAAFIPMPSAVYMPNGSGKQCNKANGTSSTNRVRWPTGAALMPDKTNILIPYVVTCVESTYYFTAQGWGFTRYNWKTNKFSQQPLDVFPAATSGAQFPPPYFFGSPIIVGKKVTFSSWGFGEGVLRTTVDLAKLKNRASYVPQPVPNVPWTYDLSVAPRSKTKARYSMLVTTSRKGDYAIFTSPSPQGPWTQKASGVLPRCNKSPVPCHSITLHPEFSPAGRFLVTYQLPAFGPGDPSKHPYPKEPLRHVVMASVPCSC